MHFWRKLGRGLRVVGTFVTSLAELLIRRPQSRQDRAAWLTKFCRRTLRAARVTWSTSGRVPDAGAVITNHLSYVDILIHAALRPCVFVSAIETRRMPLIGWISMMAGTVYVTRGAGGSAAKAASGMAEGFRDGLLATALEAGAAVTPGFLRYQLSPADLQHGRTTRADVHWGDQTLPAHLWNFLGLGSVHAHMHFDDGPIAFSAAALGDRRIAAEEAQHALLALSAVVPQSSPLQQK